MRTPSWQGLLCLLPALLFARAGCSDVIITSVDGQGTPSTVLISGDHARINHAISDGYLLLDLKKKQVYAINTREAFAMDLGSPRVRHPHGAIHLGQQTPQIRRIRQGKGPEISGYTTQRYRIEVQKKYCYDEYLAPEPLHNRELQAFLQVFSALSNAQEELQRTLLFDNSDPCDIAANTIDDQYQQLGLPMKTVLNNGALSRQITRIDTTTRISPEVFVLPKHYPILSRQEVWERQNNRPTAAERKKLLKKNRALQQKIDAMVQQRHQKRTPASSP